ncbi:hypothetical protein LSH36_118g03015 [Paralvinella palmiformis]|uniref:Glucosamine 6-phosphate N-acetyltransferase n=1 Tax=Paralvinella palmiformis TaxID=53620 RepID=A0AAD9N921_9ANNE|nr:hypothetical protein LSH36_118g03015 [Paralvinella palmiformis]
MNGIDEKPLFNPELLRQIDWSVRKSSFKDGISPENPGKNLQLRPLMMDDYDQGFLNLLGQLTSVGEVTAAAFQKRFLAMKHCPNTYYVVVLEDTNKQQVIGSATLVIEQKFIHSTGCRGRIEDVVVSEDYRGQQLGKLLVETLTLLGKEVGCYKMSLECKEDNVRFYKCFGYTPDGQYFMVQRFSD